MDIITGSQGLLAIVNTTLGFINNMKKDEDRDLALLRLLYLEISENLGVFDTIKWHTEEGLPSNNPAYESVTHGLSFAAHQAVISTRILDHDRLPGLKLNGTPIRVTRLEPVTDGVPVQVERDMQVAQALKTVCVGMSVLQRRVRMDVSPEISTNLRYGVRLKNIESYEMALRNKILQSELVKPLETL